MKIKNNMQIRTSYARWPEDEYRKSKVKQNLTKGHGRRKLLDRLTSSVQISCCQRAGGSEGNLRQLDQERDRKGT